MGAGGGQGGFGGCGGVGGKGGEGGGASIAVFSYGSKLTISRSSLTSSAGGRGGAPNAGAAGQPGGAVGTGGSASPDNYSSTTPAIEEGQDGANGANGGPGGPGGAGGGGPSVVVLAAIYAPSDDCHDALRRLRRARAASGSRRRMAHPARAPRPSWSTSLMTVLPGLGRSSSAVCNGASEIMRTHQWLLLVCVAGFSERVWLWHPYTDGGRKRWLSGSAGVNENDGDNADAGDDGKSAPPSARTSKTLCVLSADCPAGTHCDLGECVQECNEQTPCPEAETCSTRARCLADSEPDQDPVPTKNYAGTVTAEPATALLSDADRKLTDQARSNQQNSRTIPRSARRAPPERRHLSR